MEVPVGEAGLDPALAGQQPVGHGENLSARDGPELERGSEVGVGGCRGEAAGGGKLGVGLRSLLHAAARTPPSWWPGGGGGHATAGGEPINRSPG